MASKLRPRQLDVATEEQNDEASDRWSEEQGRRQVKQSGVDSMGWCGEGCPLPSQGYGLGIYNLSLSVCSTTTQSLGKKVGWTYPPQSTPWQRPW